MPEDSEEKFAEDDVCLAYLVFRLDCPCGNGEDIGDDLPPECPQCGRKVVETDV